MTATKPANLWQKIAAVRASLPAIPKNGFNPHFGSHFATVDDIDAVLIPALAANGLVMTASGVDLGGGVGFAVRVHDTENGDTAACVIPLAGLSDMQKATGATTYASRYGRINLFSLHGLVGDVDDDGNAASGIRSGSPARGSSSGQAAPNRPTSAPQSKQTGGAKDACPKCGAVGFIRRLSKGKNAGRWSCMKWPEQNFNGCGALFNENPHRKPKDADDFLAPVRQPGQERTDEPPPPSDEDLPF